MFRPRPALAWIVALVADAVQIAIFPVFGPGFASPANNVVDVVVALFMVSLLGWHWAFVPTFLVELVPFVDLAPTWTLACWLATRGRAGAAGEPPHRIPPPGGPDSRGPGAPPAA